MKVSICLTCLGSLEFLMCVLVQTHQAGTSAQGEFMWALFESETDWQIAYWFFKESVGHGSVNRFLDIPNVSHRISSLSAYT